MKYLVIGGSNGVGAAIVSRLIEKNHKIVIFDVVSPTLLSDRIEYVKLDLYKDDVNIVARYIEDANGLIITAGIGRVCEFKNITPVEIEKILKVNLVSISMIFRLAYIKMIEDDSFYSMCISSIAGLVSSPLFSVYSASKAGLCKLIEALNIELEFAGSNNRICNVVATSFQNTSFNGSETHLKDLYPLADELIGVMNSKKELHFVDEQLINLILKRYYDDAHKFSCESYTYKVNNNRIVKKSPLKI
ncbi:MAG: SDR family oxidoreductase [Bacteroidales bacterium]|nr:SDR family oxidoreductase [Bacteroidales bacterium]